MGHKDDIYVTPKIDGHKTGQQQGLKTVTYKDSNIIAYLIALGTRNQIVSTRSILRDL